MGQNEKQLIKATTKINLINNLIVSYEKINELEEYNKMKPYTIILDYKNIDDFTKFIINVQKGKNNIENIFNINFSLNNKETGLNLFQKLREKFIERDCVQYTGFSSKYGKITNHFIRKNNCIELQSNINSSKDYEGLNEYNKKINNSKIFGYKCVNTFNKTKDELQLIKAKAKINIVCDFINTLSQLNNLEEEYNKKKHYILKINYDLFKDENNNKYYKYHIHLNKLGLHKNNTILNIKFSLNNHNIGLRIIQELLRNFYQNTDIVIASFDEHRNSIIQNNSKIKIITNTKSLLDKEKINSIHNEINYNQTKIKKGQKRLY